MKRFERPEKGAAVSVNIEKVVKRFGSFPALAGVDVSIRSGEFFTLLGPSGCGKTTLLRCVAGFERPSEGRVLFNDQDMTAIPPWEKNIGFVFQNYALWPNKSVRDNIAYGLEIRKMDKAFIDGKVKWVLDLLGLPLIGNQMPEQLSGGQQQRVAIARALVIDPAILLLDEPLSNLDAKLRISLRFQIREIQRKLKITTVYVTHDQEEALEISDRIAVMDKGCILQIGTPEDIYARPEKRFVAEFVGAANIIAGRREGDFFVCSERLKVAVKREEGSCIMFRPESLEEVADWRRPDIEGRIIDVLYRGNIRRCIVDSGCPEPVVYETKLAHTIGETLRLAITQFRLYE